MDCHVADAPRNDGTGAGAPRNDESNSRHCEAEGRGNPRSQGTWIATSLTLLAMTVLALTRLAMTSQIAVIARPKAAAIHEVRSHGLPRR
jgi:hypothetical protein